MFLMIFEIAQVCHEVNRAYCEAVGDTSQKAWKFASNEQKQSIIDGVKYFLANPHATPELQHEQWMQSKLFNGWSYGPEKDEIKKTHPCLIPYNQLPQEQKVKDFLFQAVVENLRDL